MNAPFTEAETDWQKAVEGLSRASWRYADVLSKAGGDRAEAARLLWARSRHDKALREDLVKTACALFALTPAVPVGRVDAEPPIGWRQRPGPLSKCDRDPEVGAFVRERLGVMPLKHIADAAREHFGKDRAPSPYVGLAVLAPAGRPATRRVVRPPARALFRPAHSPVNCRSCALLSRYLAPTAAPAPAAGRRTRLFATMATTFPAPQTLPDLLESDMVWRWGPSLAFALVLLVAMKLRPHYLILPASVVLAVGLCHAVLLLLGISVGGGPRGRHSVSSACRRTPPGHPFNSATSIM